MIRNASSKKVTTIMKRPMAGRLWLERLGVYFDGILDLLAIRTDLLERVVGVGGPVPSRGA